MQNPCQDSYYTLFSSYPMLLDYHEEQAKNSRWIRCKVADLQVEPLGKSSPLIGNLPAFAAGTSQEAVDDTAENLGLAMRVNGELYPVRMTAYKSLLDRAKIGGTALPKLSREVLAEVLNECLKLYSADALLLIRDEKISAVHSGDEVDYSVLPIDELLKVLQAKLDARFSRNEFESGYCDHSLVSASWRMPDQKEDLLGTYAKVLAAQGKATMASKLMPGIRFMTSDTGVASAKVSALLMNGRHSIHIGGCVAVDHRHQSKVADFDTALDQLFAQFGDSIAKLQALMEIHLDFPINAMTRVCKKLSLPKKAAVEAIAMFEMSYGGGPATAHDVFLAIRFISVGDDYDSSSANAGEKLAATLKNLINDMYAKDISKKICSTMKNKRLRGDYIGNYAPYGYLKDENNRSRLVVDYEIAPIVVEIFELRAKGIGFDTICRILNEKGYPSPGRLRYERGIITNNNKKGSELPWNRHVLKDLLVNVVYIGNLAQGRSSQCLYKGEKYHWTKEADWDVVEGTHEPIISMELWNKVQEINTKVSSNVKKSFGRYAHLPKRPNPYGSVLRCADCGRVMKYVRSYTRPRKDGVVTDYYNYKCPTNIELGDTACSKKSIRADDLDKIVLSVIRKQMDLFLDTQKTLLGLIALEKEKAKHSVPANRVKELQDKLDQKKKLFSRLYIDFKDGILTQREYLLARDVYQKEIAAYESELQELQAIKTKTKVTETGARKWNRLISRYYKAETVTEEMVEAMVDEIRVNTDGSLDIRFKYMPEFEEMFKECERIRKEVA